MDSCKLQGILTDVFPVENFSNFSKKVFWLRQPDTERNPQHWAIELHTHDIDRLKGIKIGDRLECEIDIQGRKYKKKNSAYLGEEAVAVSLKCVGIRVMEKLEVPGFKPRLKPGREDDNDRYKSQTELPL